jgi:hypothetical protein
MSSILIKKEETNIYFLIMTPWGKCEHLRHQLLKLFTIAHLAANFNLF